MTRKCLSVVWHLYRCGGRTLMGLLILCCAVNHSWAAKPGANKPPSVTLTSPVNATSFAAPASITLSADAADPDGSITRVDFYQGSSLIGSSTSAPYTMIWSNVPPGSYVLTAKATDNARATASSAAVNITVVSLVVSSPADQAMIYSDYVTLSGSFTGDSTTTIIADNGQTTRLAGLSDNTYTVTLPVLHGPQTLTVALMRRDGTSEKTSINITGNKPPLMVLLSPVTNTVEAPAKVTLAVDALSPAGVIQQVSFFRNGRLLGAATAPPYQYLWEEVIPGNYLISATASDNQGYTSTVTTQVTINGPNIPPVIKLIAPVNNASYTAPVNILIEAVASDQDGSITAVEFLQNGMVLGITNAQPYRYNWKNVPTGDHLLTARATDNRGDTATALPVSISVLPPNQAPSVSLTSPDASEVFIAPATITLTAEASDSDGSITQVEFFEGTTSLGRDFTVPYALTWQNAGEGSYVLSARATDNLGTSTASAPVYITVQPNQAPSVSLTTPLSGAAYWSPAVIKLSAEAGDSDGSISSVDFWQGTTWLGSATSAPYEFSWTNVEAGSYLITAHATDNRGAVSISEQVSVIVKKPALEIRSPADGAYISGRSVLVSGYFESVPNSGVTVNGRVAALDASDDFYVNELALLPGENTITARLTTPTGQTIERVIRVYSDGAEPAVTITPDDVEVLLPQEASFTLKNNGPASASIQINGGSPFELPAGLDAVVSMSYQNPGAYPVSFTVTDAQGRVSNADFVITVMTYAQMDAALRGIYSSMLDKLGTGDIEGALQYVSSNMHDKYFSVFTALVSSLPDILNQLGILKPGAINGDMAEYVLLRETAEGPRAFLIYFLRGEDGVWRIDSM